MALTDPSTVRRIKDPDAYLREQPDLDVYAAAFADMGLSPKFAGTDVDAFFSVFMQPLHGMWERAGRILIQEHKRHVSRPDPTGGQFRALAELSKINPEKLNVIITFGPVAAPHEQQWSHLLPGSGFSGPHVTWPPQPFTADVEKWPHRRWLRLVMGKPFVANDGAPK